MIYYVFGTNTAYQSGREELGRFRSREAVERFAKTFKRTAYVRSELELAQRGR
ncbi:hypothetical protein NOC27_1336 [Nitrosococcus oceani AFC27]|uniref:hypothetical protein n=1 Tax=Nitrosococcus oceani TaxID=1229 RepID=UPI000183C61C|nr:hypothetical protein [Nitrosococcus oceani]EDZ68009.1 hypothetical protein NOC27_1336 [Nitrosococcus oceani AFC27]